MVIADFANYVLTGEAPAATAVDSLDELWSALAIYKSAKTGWWGKVWNPNLKNVHLGSPNCNAIDQ
jgi:hypothetical protein